MRCCGVLRMARRMDRLANSLQTEMALMAEFFDIKVKEVDSMLSKSIDTRYIH
jgi:hypothetical protein